jgi:hypothetical protein
VASIKCSGQALNLECANRVIVLDVWWNVALEEQAFGRVWRMGQKKETHFGRVMVRNTIDKRLSDLQISKLTTIRQAIKDHDSSKEMLTNEEIASLLGRVVHDDAGNIIDIQEDYDDDTDQESEGRTRSIDSDGSSSDSDTSADVYRTDDSSDSDLESLF